MKLQESASLVVDQYLGTCVPSDLLIHETLIGWLFENRLQRLISQTKEVNTSHDSAAQHRTPKDVINHLASKHDPSGGEYIDPLLRWYHAGHFRQEDSESMRGLLKRYHRNKSSLKFKPGDFEKPGDLRSALDQHIGKEYKPAFSKDLRPDYVEAIQRGSEQVHDDENFEIRKLRSKAHYLGAGLVPGTEEYKSAVQGMAKQDPHSRKAMQILGTGTEWCTTPERTVHEGEDLGQNIMFEHYSTQGPLYWIHDKKNNTRHVFHEGSPQFVDEHNNDSHGEFEYNKLHPKFEPIRHLLRKFNYSDEKEKIARGNFTPEEEKDLISHKSVTVRRSLASHKKIRPETIHHALVTEPDEDTGVRINLAKHDNIRQDTIHNALVTEPDKDTGVRINLAYNKKIHQDTIHHLLVTKPDTDPNVSLILARHKNISQDTIHHALVTKPHEDPKIKRALAKHDNISQDTIHHLLVTEPDLEKDPQVRYNLARHDNIRQDTIHHALVTKPDTDLSVMHALARHKNISPDTIHHALVTKPDEKNPLVRRALAKHDNISQDTIHHLLVTEPDLEKDPEVRYNLASHDNISPDTIHRLLVTEPHEDPEVRYALANNKKYTSRH